MNVPPMSALLSAACLAGTHLFLPQAAAQTEPFPAKPVRVVVGLPAGGGADVMARIIAASLGDGWHTQVIVENRVGAAGMMAAEAVAKSNPDGHTLLFGSVGTHAILPNLYRNLSYNPARDFSEISLAVTLPNVFLVHVPFPAKTLNEFIAHARAHPGTIKYASAGVGSTLHLSMEMLRSRAGITLVHVPYKGGVQAFPDLASGQIQAMFEILPTALPNIQAGKVRALAVTTAKRSLQLADVPTIAEAGMPGFEVTTWYALFAPAKTAPSTVARISADVAGAIAAPRVRERIAQLGAEAASSSPAQLAAFVKAETAKWAKVITDAGIVAE